MRDGAIATLAIDRVWITRHGYAKLLDFRAPGVQPTAHRRNPPPRNRGRCFWRSLRGAPSNGRLTNRAWPPHGLASAAARRIGDDRDAGAARVCDLVGGRGPDGGTAAGSRSCGPLPACRVAERLWYCSCESRLSVLLIINPLMTRTLPPDVMALTSALRRLDLSRPVDSRERAALEVYIAGRFRPMITDRQHWTNPVTVGLLLRASSPSGSWPSTRPSPPTSWRRPQRRSVRSSEQQAAASALLHLVQRLSRALIGLILLLLTFIALFGLVWAFLLRGGLLLRACGIAVVTVDGKPASRLRALWRGLVAWGLVPAALVLVFTMGPAIGSLAGVLLLAGAVLAVVDPGRGLQDRIAGTRLVPQWVSFAGGSNNSCCGVDRANPQLFAMIDIGARERQPVGASRRRACLRRVARRPGVTLSRNPEGTWPRCERSVRAIEGEPTKRAGRGSGSCDGSHRRRSVRAFRSVRRRPRRWAC